MTSKAQLTDICQLRLRYLSWTF